MTHRIRVAIFVAALLTLVQPVFPASVPNPVVTGPIPANAAPGDPSRDYPFFSAMVDLATYGYVEQEFFIEGFANRYSTPAMDTGSIIDGGHLYRTRVLVRRPASPARFNGTVVVEMQNPAAGFDSDVVWLEICEHLIRRGYAWIGVSALQAGVHTAGTGLKAWSPARYGRLDLSASGAIKDDSLAFDVFSQAVQAIKSPMGADLLGGLRVERVIASGVSIAAVRLRTYYNSIHPLAGVVDGFLLVHGGRMLRADGETKVFKILSESEVAHQTADRQEDSRQLRSWEIAGTSHMDFYYIQESGPPRLRDGLAPHGATCEFTPYSRIPERYAANAMLEHLVRWIRDDMVPPSAPGIETQLIDGQIVVSRDPFGNALGGVRLPQHQVPIATNTGVNSGNCRVLGSHLPFDDSTLSMLYPSHGSYVSAVVKAALENLEMGYLVLEDAVTTIEEAAQSGIGRQ